MNEMEFARTTEGELEKTVASFGDRGDAGGSRGSEGAGEKKTQQRGAGEREIERASSRLRTGEPEGKIGEIGEMCAEEKKDLLPEEEIFCRICYCFENSSGSRTDLISPCGCKGTVKYVHRECLRIWRYRGKLVKDIKTCEQCRCEYLVEDEKKISAVIIWISTAATVLSLVLATNLFLLSTADTFVFVASDISSVFGGMDGKREFPYEGPFIICNMDKAPGKDAANEERRLILRKIVCPNGKEHYLEAPNRKTHAFKNISLLNVRENGAFSSISALAFIYASLGEKKLLLLFNLLLSLWRVVSIGQGIDWAVYCFVVFYAYVRIFRKLYRKIDSYCMYMANLY